MKSKYIVLILILAMVILSEAAIAGKVKSDLSKTIEKKSPNEEIRVIIKFHERQTDADINDVKFGGAKIKHNYRIIKAVSAKIPAHAIERIANKNFVELIEPDYEAKAVLDVSVPKIRADDAWNYGITGRGVDVAVVDTGIKDEHIALVVEKEADFTGEGTDDLNGHGTHVAGIIASTDSTYKGVAYNADLFNAKVLNKYGSGYTSDVISGIEWAVDNGAEIISMSLGARVQPCDGTDALSQAVDAAVNSGVVVVVAAGNSGPSDMTILSPGCSKEAITVGAVDDDDSIASFSSRGPTADSRIKPDVVAPGVSIMSTWMDLAFRSLSGTSMATPHVSGVAAMLLEADPELRPDEVKELLKSNSVDLGLNENMQGAGRIDAYKAVDSILKDANLSIVSFASNASNVILNNTFTLSLVFENNGDKKAEGVSAEAILPYGLSTDVAKRNIGLVLPMSKMHVDWVVNAEKEGVYGIKANVDSTNDGSDSAEVMVVVKSLIENRTIKERNETDEYKKLPYGIEKKNLTLPPGIAKKVILPDSFFTYGFKRIFERADLFFTFDKEKRDEKQLGYAEKRLLEAAEMNQKGKKEYVDNLVKEYNKAVGIEEIKHKPPEKKSAANGIAKDEVPVKEMKKEELNTLKKEKVTKEPIKEIPKKIEKDEQKDANTDAADKPVEKLHEEAKQKVEAKSNEEKRIQTSKTKLEINETKEKQNSAVSLEIPLKDAIKKEDKQGNAAVSAADKSSDDKEATKERSESTGAKKGIKDKNKFTGNAVRDIISRILH